MNFETFAAQIELELVNDEKDIDEADEEEEKVDETANPSQSVSTSKAMFYCNELLSFFQSESGCSDGAISALIQIEKDLTKFKIDSKSRQSRITHFYN